ncbi:hypothetical protein WJX75_002248 [Coccomyxa subellipsoidea]|uniref:Phospholipase/carboxylesterase/thioesterase domain-containing protein n=1 Tax=Coccomyxa subellipsoidea TaxID=248742 RepID=A0ABR2YLY2_9CHLO
MLDGHRLLEQLIIMPTLMRSLRSAYVHRLNRSALRNSSVPNISHVKFVFPTAPTRPVTMNGGMRMPAWFDLDPRIIGSVDHEGINSSISYLEELVAEEVKAGVPLERIVLGGFSQGGHIALKYLFQAQTAPAACIALSTWLEPTYNKQVPESSKAVKILLGHGTSDPLLPLALAQSTAALLRQKGLSRVEFKTYNGMQHSTCPEELSDIRRFLFQMLPAADLPSRYPFCLGSTKVLDDICNQMP